MYFVYSYVRQEGDREAMTRKKKKYKECQQIPYLDSHIYVMEPFTVVLWAPLQHIERARHLMCIPQVNSIYVDFDRDNNRRRECQNSKE